MDSMENTYTEETLHDVPLTQSQRGVYLECMNEPDSTRYNIAFTLLLPKETDLSLFERAVCETALKHPALFVTMGMGTEGPVMHRHNPKKDEVRIAHGKASCREEAEKKFIRPFDLEKGPLYRFELCEIPEGTLFLFDIPHVINDGTTVALLLSQITGAYEGKEVPDEEMTIFEVSEAEGRIKESPKYKEAQEFFKKQFGDSEYETQIIPDVDPKTAVREEGILSVYTPAELSLEKIESFAKSQGIRESALFMAAFSYTESVFSGSDEAFFTTADSGRYGLPLSKTVGMFVRTLPIHVRIPESGLVSDYLKDIQEIFDGTLRNDCISYSELVNDYGVNSNISYVYQSKLLSEVSLCGMLLMPKELPLGDAQSDIIMMPVKTETDYELRFHYRRNLYSSDFIQSFADTVLMVLKGMMNHEKLNDITLITDGQKNLINSVNQTERSFDKEETVGKVFLKVASEHPENEALRFKEKSYTYGEFLETAKAVASYIRKKGLGTDDFVAVLAGRNDEAVLSAWGIILSGAAFEMLDPTYPAERLNYMVTDSKAKLLIAERSLALVLSEYHGDILYTDEIFTLKNDDLSYEDFESQKGALTMIYTSGTTGKPKGCVLENRNLTAFYHNHTDVMKIDEKSRVATYASFGFDAGAMDIVSTLMAGACLYIIPDEIRLDFMKMEEFFCENKITHGFMTTQVGRTFAEETKCSSLKALLVGGEKLVPFTPKKTFRFINGYGPCETFAYICHHEVTDNSSIQPIGKPGGNTKLYVSDKLGRLVPIGAPGELLISGAQVGRGYLGLLEKTAEVFKENPYCKETGYERVYKTGDVVRLLSDGSLEFIGRRDNQVKIRGFRVELTEIEEVIRRFGGVKDATVCAFDDMAGGKFIAAYVSGPETIDTDKLNAFIRAEKPAYMVPAVTMQLPSIPYTQNHKVDKRALPKPERTHKEGRKPENETEQRIYGILVKVLGHEELDALTDLFDAGLTSIGTLKLNMMLSKEFGVPVKIVDIKDNPNIKELAEFIKKAVSGSEKGTLVGAFENEPEDYPLMSNQMGVFIECSSDNGTTRYNMPVLLKLSDDIDPEKLCEAVKKAVDAHPYLKATLKIDEKGEIRAERHDGDEASVSVIRLSALPGVKELVRPFNLIGGRLYRAGIYVTEDGNYLFIDIHHIAADGTSVNILLRDIDTALCGNEPEKEGFTGFDAALMAEKAAASGDEEKSEKYFDSLLSGSEGDSLPGKCPQSEGTFETVACSFDACSEKIRSYCRKNALSENAFFNAVFSYTLSEFIHSDDVTYCTIYNGRSDSRLMDCVSMLVKTLPVRSFINAQQKAIEHVRSVQAQLLDTMSADSMPFSEICAKYGIKAELFFNYQGDGFKFDTLGGKKAEMIPLKLSDAKVPLSVEVFLSDGIYRAETTYRTDCYCREFADSFTESLMTAAESFTEADTLSGVQVLSESGKKHFDEMNKTETPFEKVPAHTFLERWAKENPQKDAVITRETSVTFSKLNEMADSVAKKLLTLSAGNGEFIGLILDRSELVPATELGILKAGCAFLPMLPSYPDDRLMFCLKDAGCRFVISTGDIIRERQELFGGEKPYKALKLEELLEKGSEKENKNKAKVSIPMDQAAYCIYTSGSTGKPKGVVIEHHSLTNFVQTSGLCETLANGNVCMCMASISFDMSITEMFFSLSRGKTIYIASEEEVHNPDLLMQGFKKNKVDIMMMTPSFAWSLLSMPEFEASLSGLRSVVLGAEAFQPVLLARLKKLNPKMLVQNGYGPTECTQVCSVKTLSEGGSITIGSPFANTKFYVSDVSGNLLPRYAVGELIICGEGVCRGYVNLPEKNAAAFTKIEGVRAYRSGDLVRINRDNEAEFGGRADSQVKLRGFRIELSEVEAVMQEFPGVRQCKVIVRNNGTEDFLAGFFTAAWAVDTDELTAFMKTKLTYYMVPQAMMQLNEMPMTQNGKLDKKALPEIRPVRKAKAKRAPRKSLEEKILDIFKSVLTIDDCYVDDSFFEVGGTSLSASKVVMQLKSEGYKIEYQDIFDHQSAEELSEYLHSLEPLAKKTVGELSEKDGEPYTPEGIFKNGMPFVKTEPEIEETLKHNSMEYADKVKREPLGDVLLTGATGFLGIHVLRELIESEKGRIICLARRGSYDNCTARIKSMLVYYFEEDFREEFDKRITVIEGDITAGNLSVLFKDIHFDTLINCAACVKHYAKDDSIEFVNVHGVENLIKLTEEKNAKMIQISTTSVPGAHNDDTYRIHIRMTEDRLFVVDDMNNQYIQSKYQAELRMLKAVKNGLRGKIIRVGNLMGRYTDGEFQTNMRQNAFLNGLRGFVNIGKCPISHSTDPMNFSPVDCTAKAVVLLAGTCDFFTAFNADSRQTFDEMKVIDTINRCGITVKPVMDEEYYADFYRMMGDSEKNEKVSALLTNDRPDVHMVETDNRFTANVLYRLGFSWPFISDDYLEKVIESLATLAFFDD